MEVATLTVKMMLTLFAALWPAVGEHTQIEVVDGPTISISGYGYTVDSYGQTWCGDAHDSITLESESTITNEVDSPLVRIAFARDNPRGYNEVLYHELIHAYDCLDNGLIDGSPMALYSHGLAGETYVYEVLRTGRLH